MLKWFGRVIRNALDSDRFKEIVELTTKLIDGATAIAELIVLIEQERKKAKLTLSQARFNRLNTEIGYLQEDLRSCEEEESNKRMVLIDYRNQRCIIEQKIANRGGNIYASIELLNHLDYLNTKMKEITVEIKEIRIKREQIERKLLELRDELNDESDISPGFAFG